MLSVISDAGDQQQKRQKHIRSARSSVNSDFNLEESLPNLPAEHELQGHLVDARQETWVNEHLQKFIPKEELWRIVNIGSVYRVLAQKLLQVHPPEQIMKYAKKICKETEVIQGNEKLIKSYRKIFSILVLLELASSILHFLEEDVSDLDLPIERLQETEDLYRKGDRDKTPLKCFKRTGWSPMNLEDFQHKQWWMLAPFFSRDEDGAVKHYVLQNQHVLPFSPIPASNRETGFIPHKAGGYGKVLMVQINSQHHNFHDMMHSDRGFAVKQQIDFEDRDAYKKEIAILKRFTGRHSDHHIVSLLASYEQFNKFHLIFHRAEGTLHELWTEFQTNPGLTQENILWMAEQCAGLASALSKFHRHFSFPKPPNIARVDQNIPKSMYAKILSNTEEEKANIVQIPVNDFRRWAKNLSTPMYGERILGETTGLKNGRLLQSHHLGNHFPPLRVTREHCTDRIALRLHRLGNTGVMAISIQETYYGTMMALAATEL